MTNVNLTALMVIFLAGCKRDPAPEPRIATPAPVAVARDAAVAVPELSWYRGAIRAPDGVEAAFFLGVPTRGAGQAVFKVGDHEVRTDATFDGTTLNIALTVHQTAINATAGPDGVLRGSFSTSWHAFGASSLPLTATKVAAPALATLATLADGSALDLGESRSTWRLAMHESGIAKLVIHQVAPGELEGMLFLDTGNIIYVAGNARGLAAALTGFDGTSAYRLELALDADRKRAHGRLIGGSRLDWREDLTAIRGADFALGLKPKAIRPGVKIGLPDLPELAALDRGPLVIEIGGSWCSTCRNAAPFFVELYRTYQPRGLRMLTLLYEFTEDHAADVHQADLFTKTYGATWPVVPVPGSIDDFSEIMPTGLADLNPAGFPITLFLAADRSLVAMHAGFPATSATEERARVAAEFRANIETLLAHHP